MKKEHLTVLLEEMNGKFTAVLEGHAALDRKIDALHADMGERFAIADLKMDALNHKIDAVQVMLSHDIAAVAADLKAHRADTESHVTGYRVGEQSDRYEEGQKSRPTEPTNGAK